MAAVYWFLEMLYIYFQYHSTNEMCVLAVYKKRRDHCWWSSEILCTE